MQIDNSESEIYRKCIQWQGITDIPTELIQSSYTKNHSKWLESSTIYINTLQSIYETYGIQDVCIAVNQLNQFLVRGLEQGFKGNSTINQKIYQFKKKLYQTYLKSNIHYIQQEKQENQYASKSCQSMNSMKQTIQNTAQTDMQVLLHNIYALREKLAEKSFSFSWNQDLSEQNPYEVQSNTVWTIMKFYKDLYRHLVVCLANLISKMGGPQLAERRTSLQNIIQQYSAIKINCSGKNMPKAVLQFIVESKQLLIPFIKKITIQ